MALAAVLLAVAWGGYRALTDGRAKAATTTDLRLTTDRLGAELGTAATLVQFSAPFCAPCRATRAILAEVTAGRPELRHIDLDAATRLDLIEAFDITRTPTVLVLDRHGALRQRIVGAARKGEVLAALNSIKAVN